MNKIKKTGRFILRHWFGILCFAFVLYMCFGGEYSVKNILSLRAQENELRKEIEEDALLCPMIDARRMEVYAGIYDRSLRPICPVQADVVEADTYKEFLDAHPVYFFGNGAAKCMEAINHPHAHLIENIVPLAKWMFPLAEKRIALGQYEDVAYFTPFYLKDFVAKTPKKLL